MPNDLPDIDDPDPHRDLKLDPLEPYGRLHKENLGVTIGLYRGFIFLDPPRGLGTKVLTIGKARVQQN